MTPKEKVDSLRKEMKENDIDVFVIYSADPHMSEYLPFQWKEREWISGFTGSYGYVVVTKDKAGLWTDGRYFIQAEEQLQGSGIDMVKDRLVDSINYVDWIISETSEKAKIAVNALATSRANWKEAKTKLNKYNRELIDLPLLDKVWVDREYSEKNPVFVHPIERAGKKVEKKIAEIREEMKSQGATAHIISSLDDVAWTLNLRGSDIEFNPVFLGYILITLNEVKFFVDPNQLNEEAQALMKESSVELANYDHFFEALKSVKDEIILISSQCNQAVFAALEDDNECVVGSTPPGNIMKAIKNEAELEGFEKVMIRDGVAMVKFLYWLVHNVGKEELNEYSIGQKLYEYRAAGENFIGESFATIVGYKGNDALPHYKAASEGSKEVTEEGSVLIDSGGQYLEGTTDITRTIPLGEMTEEFKKDYTTVMKAYLALARVKFPKGTRGAQVDILARLPLWEEGKDFIHGTGHGVGSFLNVHEGPQAIRKESNPHTLKPGMVMSNEPGYYAEGKYGIRHENLFKIQEYKTTEWNIFYEFKTITYCPYFKEPLVGEMLTEEEVEQFNAYHKLVEKKLSPHLDGDVKEWFLKQVAPL